MKPANAAKFRTVINTLPGVEANTPPARRINFKAYIQPYVGTSMLPPFPEMTELKMNNEFRQVDISPSDPPTLTCLSPRLNDSNASIMYESYHRFHLVLDYQAQELENNMCTLVSQERSAHMETILVFKKYFNREKC
jgi:hypothetical protein